MDDDERKALLWPPWATNGLEDLRYDQLDDAGKEVWRATRGQRTDTDTIDKWLTTLGEAVTRKFITEDDAVQAIARVMHHE